jgi:hypothetical protein
LGEVEAVDVLHELPELDVEGLLGGCQLLEESSGVGGLDEEELDRSLRSLLHPGTHALGPSRRREASYSARRSPANDVTAARHVSYFSGGMGRASAIVGMSNARPWPGRRYAHVRALAS